MNRGDLRHLIEIWGEVTPENATPNAMGEILPVKTLLKKVFASLEFRGGGLLTGRPADSVLSQTTQKFTYPFKDYPVLIPDKNWIEYNGKKYNILYTLNEGVKDEYLQVFTNEKEC